jgi:hypothetical protein
VWAADFCCVGNGISRVCGQQISVVWATGSLLCVGSRFLLCGQRDLSSVWAADFCCVGNGISLVCGQRDLSRVWTTGSLLCVGNGISRVWATVA